MTAPFSTTWTFPDYCPLCVAVAIQDSALDFSFAAHYAKSRPAIEHKLESADDNGLKAGAKARADQPKYLRWKGKNQ